VTAALLDLPSRTYHSPRAVDDWNVLATSVEGARPMLLAGLRRHGAFRGGGYRNVAIGRVADTPAFLTALRDDVAHNPVLAAALARVLPIDRTLELAERDPLASLETAVAALGTRVDGSFFVRLERRGLRGTLHSSDVERALGASLWRAIEAEGRTPRVTFDDPDVVVAIETLGSRVGIALIDRALRQAYPFVRVR
jgi:tRNA(Ser,Leu) C12 N-acetylase TAN1